MTDSRALFREKVPGIMRSLMRDFDLTVEDAAAICGNLGHESGGFRFLQEKKPLIPGSAGGYGWAQWTGPRRRAYEAYCARNNLDGASDKANYGFLFLELKGPESAAISATKAAGSLKDKVIAFESKFERAGIKHYDSRLVWATVALSAFGDAPPIKNPVKEAAKDAGKVTAGTGTVGTGAGANSGWGAIEWLLMILVVALIGAGTFAVMYYRRKKNAERDEIKAPIITPGDMGLVAVASALQKPAQNRNLKPLSDTRRKSKAPTAKRRVKKPPSKKKARV